MTTISKAYVVSHHNTESTQQKPNAIHDKYLIQNDDVDIEVFTEYLKKYIQHQNSQTANSKLSNNVVSLIYSYLSKLELKVPQGDSQTEISRHATVRQEIHTFSKFSNAISEKLTCNEITQHVEHDLQKILTWFIIDYFVHNNDLIALARKTFKPQNTDDETILAEQTDYVWDPEWSHESFIDIPTDISSQAISTISIHKDYVNVYPLTIGATPSNYYSFFPERAGNNSLSSTFIDQDNLNGTRNLSQQDIQTP